MYSFVAVTSDQLKTIQSSADQLENLKIILIFLLSYALLVGLLNLLFYFIYKKSPDFRLSCLLPTFFRGSSLITINSEDHMGRPLGFIKCTIFKEEKIYKVFYPWRSQLRLALPEGEYSAVVSKFGYQSAPIDSFKVTKGQKLKFNLSLKATEDVAEVKSLSIFAWVLLGLTIVLFACSLSVYFLNFLALPLSIQLVTLVLSGASGYLSYRYLRLTKFIQTFSFKGRALRNQPIEIFGPGRDPLKKVTTSKNAKLALMLSPGHYRFSPEKYSPRVVRVFELGLGNFKIKF